MASECPALACSRRPPYLTWRGRRRMQVLTMAPPLPFFRVQSAAALSNLARESEGNRNCIIEANGIPPLLALLDSHNPRSLAG